MTAGQSTGLPPEVFIVDDDPTVHDSLSAAFRRSGVRVTNFVDGNTFLRTASQLEPAFVLLDVNLPDISGLEVLKQLGAPQYPNPVFMLSGKRDVPVVVEAIKSGALDYIVKPFDADVVVARVRSAFATWVLDHDRDEAVLLRRFARFDSLTPRERIVLAEIASGVSNRLIGRNLGISRRTVEVHRAHIMEKLGVKNAVDLMRAVLGSGKDR
jgi:FixJ family two-component response regulator